LGVNPVRIAQGRDRRKEEREGKREGAREGRVILGTSPTDTFVSNRPWLESLGLRLGLKEKDLFASLIQV